MKKVIEGYIARTEPEEIMFSNQPMRQGGFFGDNEVWYRVIETDEEFPVNFRVDMHEYMDIPELTEENSPRHCTITIEIGEQAGEVIDPEFTQKRERIRHNCAVLAEETGRSYDEMAQKLMEIMPESKEFLTDKED